MARLDQEKCREILELLQDCVDDMGLSSDTRWKYTTAQERYAATRFGRSSVEVLLRVLALDILHKGQSAIDIGSGDGFPAIGLAACTGACVFGVELDPRRVEVSNQLNAMFHERAAAAGIVYSPHQVIFAAGDVRVPKFLPAIEINAATLIYWNNYGGWWTSNIETQPDGSKSTMQTAVLRRLVPNMSPSAVLISLHPIVSRRSGGFVTVMRDETARGNMDKHVSANLYVHRHVPTALAESDDDSDSDRDCDMRYVHSGAKPGGSGSEEEDDDEDMSLARSSASLSKPGASPMPVPSPREILSPRPPSKVALLPKPIAAPAPEAAVASVVVKPVAAVKKQPAAVKKQPAAVKKQPAAVKKQPAAVKKQPAAAVKRKPVAAVKRKPVATAKRRSGAAVKRRRKPEMEMEIIDLVSSDDNDVGDEAAESEDDAGGAGQDAEADDDVSVGADGNAEGDMEDGAEDYAGEDDAEGDAEDDAQPYAVDKVDADADADGEDNAQDDAEADAEAEDDANADVDADADADADAEDNAQDNAQGDAQDDAPDEASDEDMPLIRSEGSSPRANAEAVIDLVSEDEEEEEDDDEGDYDFGSDTTVDML